MENLFSYLQVDVCIYMIYKNKSDEILFKTINF